jgi:predicted porin
MNKKVMAVAVAGVLAAPTAFAQSSNVQLYGRAVLGVDYYSATGARDQGATPGSQINMEGRMRVFDNSSRVGLRGTEDLGNGLKAIFQIETGVNIDNGSNAGQAGTNNVSSGFWASRDSFAGIDSNFGRLTFGRQSIYWANGVNAQFAANYINTEIPWTNGTGLGRVGIPTARTSNTVQYTTPTFAGINATLSWSPCAGYGAFGSATAGTLCAESVQNNQTMDTDGRVWGATVRGEWGPFYGQVDYLNGKGNSFLSGAPRPDADFWKVGGSWGYMPGARIGLIWVYGERNYVPGLATATNANQQGWTINWEHTFGNFQVMAQYGMIGDIKDCGTIPVGGIDCSDSDSSGYMIGGRYFLSKRTWLFASYNRVTNGDNQFSDYTGGNITSTGGSAFTPYGANPQIFAVGLFHQF